MQRTFINTSSPVRNPSSGNYFFPVGQSGPGTSNALGNTTARAVQWWNPTALSIIRVGAEITSTGEAGSKLRLGIWADNGANYPGAVLLDAGQIAGDSATVQELTVSFTLPAGWCWLGGVVQSAATTQPTVRTVSTSMAPLAPLNLGTSAPAANTQGPAVQASAAFAGALGTFPASTTISSLAPRLFLRVA